MSPNMRHFIVPKLAEPKCDGLATGSSRSNIAAILYHSRAKLKQKSPPDAGNSLRLILCYAVFNPLRHFCCCCFFLGSASAAQYNGKPDQSKSCARTRVLHPVQSQWWEKLGISDLARMSVLFCVLNCVKVKLSGNADIEPALVSKLRATEKKAQCRQCQVS